MSGQVTERSRAAKYLVDIIDSARQLLDDMVDYTNDTVDYGDKIQRDLRRTTRQVFRPGRCIADPDEAAGTAGTSELKQLGARVAELSARLAAVEKAETVDAGLAQ